jgi:hypothetical protein
MPKLVIPIADRVLRSTGDVLLRAGIDLDLKDVAGNFLPENFLINTGTEVTTFPAYRAKTLGLPIPQHSSAGVGHKQTGLEVRSGVLRFRIPGLDASEYAVNCFFLGDPDTPPDPNVPAAFPRKLLQPFQLLDHLRFNADKDPSDGTAYGTLTVEKK